MHKEVFIMDVFYTLQDFLTHTKGVIYVLMPAALIGITGFWLFLTDRDEDEIK